MSIFEEGFLEVGSYGLDSNILPGRMRFERINEGRVSSTQVKTWEGIRGGGE